MTAPLVAKVGGGFGLAALAAVLVPRLGDAGRETPSLATLLLTAVCVGALTTAVLYLALTRDLGVTRTVAVYGVAYNALVVLVKFVLSPDALYEHSEAGTFEAFLDPSRFFDATLIAATVFALYALALYVIYRICRRRLETRSFSWKRAVVIAALTAALVLATGWFLLVAAWGGLEYVDFVFTSSVSLLVAGALVGSIALASIAFRDAADRAALLGDAAVLVSVFWVALAFLALYHALWVVYVLVLTTI